VNFTARDLLLLKAIDRYGLVSTRQLKYLIFKAINHRTMLRRLRLLEKKRLIERHSGLPHGKLVWTLGNEGLKRAGSRTKVTINRNSLEHDALVTSVRIALDQAGIGMTWRSSHLLRQQASEGISPEYRDFDQIPDAMFAIQTKEGIKIVALEVEIVAKSKRRYRKILELYQYKDAIDVVWYVVPAPKLGSLILTEATETPKGYRSHKFHWSALGDLLQNPRSVLLHSISKSQRLSEIWEVKLVIGNSNQEKATTPLLTQALTM
jgi:hypothetical protein